MDITNDNQQTFEAYTAMADKVYGNLNQNLLTTKRLVDKLKMVKQMKH